MATPSMICRGKNLHLASLKHFFDALPREAMPKAEFFAFAEARMDGFSRTHSQIARQLGLYYCDKNGVCHPRFADEPNFDDVCKYARYWAEHYYIPNPYTPSFPDSYQPRCVYGHVYARCSVGEHDLAAMFRSLFDCELADVDKARSYLINFAPIVEYKDWQIRLRHDAIPVSVDVQIDRNDIVGYFHFFDGWCREGISSNSKRDEEEVVGDRLGVALKAFARNRGDGSWAAGYYETNKGTRDYYATLSASIEALDVAKVEEMFLGVKDAKGNVVFQPMWSGSNGTGWGHIKKGLDENPQATIDAIKKYCADASVVSAFTQKDFVRPSGFGDSVVSELLMKFHPDAAIKCGTKTIDVLKKLNMMSFKHDGSYDAWEYRQVLGVATGIKLRMDEMGITRTLEDHNEADYITVNEFIAWCHDNYDLIMQEWSKHMKHEIKLTNQTAVTENDFAAFIQKFIDAAKAAKLTYDDNLIKRFVCALLAKPFVVLTGLSGSGKTKLAQIFTQWIATQDMYRIVPVGADWTNSEKLLGYPNALDPNNYILPDTGVLKLMIDANDNPTVPFFLILDEMNLSHVERYFADFLSAMESEGSIKLYDGKNRTADDGTPVPPTIPFPKNLFVIGTMNVDETTHAFSPKVLDRAQVIEFRVNENQINAFLDNPTKPDLTQIDGKGVEYAAAFLNLHDNPIELSADDKTKMNDPLKKFFPVLAELSSEFAFRTASEALKFCGFARKSVMSEEETIDAAIMQKLLPKLHGSRRRLAASLEAFWGFCRKDGKTQSIADVCKKDATDKVEDVAKFPVSAEKIRRLYKAAEQNGFASYAEA